MTVKRDKTYLTHILESIEKLPRHFSRLEQGVKWHADETVSDAVLRTQTMAESCSKLSQETKKLAPEIEWNKIAGFRNILVHDYLGDIDYVTASRTIEVIIPQLKNSVRYIYKELYG